METNSKGERINFLSARISNGWLRVIITFLFCFTSLAFLYAGFLLIKDGVTGSWTIVTEFKGWQLYVTSIAPGLLIVLSGASLLYFLSKTMKHIPRI